MASTQTFSLPETELQTTSQWLRVWTIKLGMVRSVLFAALLAALLSSLVMLLVGFFMGYRTFEEYRLGLIFSTVVPFLISTTLGVPVVRMIMDLHLAEKEMRYHATHDTLTGLLNRRTVLERVEYFFQIASREKHSFSIVLADIDDFKNINDTYGHAAGDAVLAELGVLFNSNLRASDSVGRYGGEEFVFFLPYASIEAAKEFTSRLHKMVNEKVISVANQSLGVTLSIGIANYRPEVSQSVDDLLSAADSAMYVAKNRGKNRTVAFGTATLSTDSISSFQNS